MKGVIPQRKRSELRGGKKGEGFSPRVQREIYKKGEGKGRRLFSSKGNPLRGRKGSPLSPGRGRSRKGGFFLGKEKGFPFNLAESFLLIKEEEDELPGSIGISSRGKVLSQ